MSLCVHQGNIEKNPTVIMSAMHVSFSMLEARHACTASSMSSTDSGSTRLGGGSSFCTTEIVASVQILACHAVVGVGPGGWAPVGQLSVQLHLRRFPRVQVCTVYDSG